MVNLPSQPLPAAPHRILLLNPTKYLGNVLLAGGLIQDFAALCRRHDREFMLVLDASFQELCSQAFADVPVLWYPRRAIGRARPWRKLTMWLKFLRALREFRADLAFNMEEDSLSSRLTQLSGAPYRLGCSPARHRFGYERVLPIQYGARHRWYAYQEAFIALGLPESSRPNYVNLHITQVSKLLMEKLHELGVNPELSLIAIHPAATKDYKKWPETAFIELCIILINKGFYPILIGAGQDEWQRCERIQRFVAGIALTKPLNLCDRLTLPELAGFLGLCKGIVGNDSGPSHLASALGLPGVVIFGPSDPALWKPLGVRSRVLRKVEHCDPRCSRRACFAEYRCLHAVRPEEVCEVLEAQMRTGATP